ncbi:MAG TPA: ZIP family metal transporter [Gaiella sp.]|uniref:ZIP family metal transporter n=1 Tax=Gaiella sp. TaxID=2663207 RepID=UPI002D7F8061|nr:ZIP family metal transporter [Gaiella sp.]HET9288557.1 ZIP family metal transporter [Gaiella sp.]
MEARTEAAPGGVAWRLWALVPIVLLAVAVAGVVSQGDRVVDLVGGNPPPADEFDVRRVEFRPGVIRVQVRNPQPDDLTIALVTVDDAIVPFTLDGPATLGRLRSSTIVVPYDWVEEEPIAIGVTSSTGIQTTHEVPAAVLTPQPSVRGFLGYGLIGALVGILPVALGLLWLPSLRRADPRWIAAFMALTGGLLTFLGVEALAEALELQAVLPSALGGPGLVLLGLAASALGMTFLSSRLSRGKAGATGLALALLVAIGIGVHNLGEGLAIGSSFATGELQLGAFLVIGFMVHNVTEGLGIAAPASRTRVSVRQLLALALVAGAPAILGTWLGGYASSDVLTPLFFALAAGAALQVVVEVGRYVARTAPGGLRSGWVVGGYLAGIAAMWATGLLIG